MTQQTSIVPFNQRPAEQAITIAMPSAPSSSEIESYNAMAKVVAYSGFLNSNANMSNITQRAADAFFVMMRGRELGIPPTTALSTIYVIDGKPSCSGQALLSLMLRAGIQVQMPDPGSVTDSATIRVKRPGADEWQTFTYTKKMADDAGLSGKRNWKNHLREMLIWRAVSTAARFAAPDVVGGLYTIEEINPNIDVNEQGDAVNAMQLKPIPQPQAKQEDIQEGEFVESPQAKPGQPPQEQQQHPGTWATPENITTLISMAKGKGWGDSEADLLKLADVKSWEEFDSGKAAGAALQVAHDALTQEMQKKSNGKQEAAQDQPEQPKTVSGHVTQAYYKGTAKNAFIGFPISEEIEARIYSRTEFAKMIGEALADVWDVTNWQLSKSPLKPATYKVDVIVEAELAERGDYYMVKKITVPEKYIELGLHPDSPASENPGDDMSPDLPEVTGSDKTAREMEIPF